MNNLYSLNEIRDTLLEKWKSALEQSEETFMAYIPKSPSDASAATNQKNIESFICGKLPDSFVEALFIWDLNNFSFGNTQFCRTLKGSEPLLSHLIPHQRQL